MFNKLLLTMIIVAITASPSMTRAENKVKKDERCSVCGMFVAKYPAWITKIEHKDGRVVIFDGVKDMMVYFHDPEQYGASATNGITDIKVKDYYSLALIDAKKSFFVIGSDVYGPMGHEFISFSSKEAAQSFLKDHHGKKILLFTDITSELVESLRAGHRMK